MSQDTCMHVEAHCSLSVPLDGKCARVTCACVRVCVCTLYMSQGARAHAAARCSLLTDRHVPADGQCAHAAARCQLQKCSCKWQCLCVSARVCLRLCVMLNVGE